MHARPPVGIAPCVTALGASVEFAARKAAPAYTRAPPRRDLRCLAPIGESHDTATKRPFSGQPHQDTQANHRCQSRRAHAGGTAERSGGQERGGEGGEDACQAQSLKQQPRSKELLRGSGLRPAEGAWRASMIPSATPMPTKSPMASALAECCEKHAACRPAYSRDNRSLRRSAFRRP